MKDSDNGLGLFLFILFAIGIIVGVVLWPENCPNRVETGQTVCSEQHGSTGNYMGTVCTKQYKCVKE